MGTVYLKARLCVVRFYSHDAAELANERRPKRAKKTKAILAGLLPKLFFTIQAHEARESALPFDTLRKGCSECLRAEILGFNEVTPPAVSTSVLK